MEYGQELKNPNRLDRDIFITPPQSPALGDISGDDEIPDLHPWVSHDPNNPFLKLSDIDFEFNQTDHNYENISKILIRERSLNPFGDMYCQPAASRGTIGIEEKSEKKRYTDSIRDRLKKKLEEKRSKEHQRNQTIRLDEIGIPITHQQKYLEKDIENIFGCWKDN